MDIGTILSLGTAGVNAFNGLRNYQTQKDAYERQYELTKEGLSEQKRLNDFNMDWTKNSYQYSVQDMLKAGLNPALMYGSASNASASSLNAGDTNIGAKAPQLDISMRDAIAVEQLSQQAELNKAQIAKTNAEADLANSQSGHLSLTDELLKKFSDIDFTLKEIQASKGGAETRLLEQNLENLKVDLLKKNEEINLMIKNNQLRAEEIIKIRTENQALSREIERLKSTDQYKSDTGVIKTIKQICGQIDTSTKSSLSTDPDHSLEPRRFSWERKRK